MTKGLSNRGGGAAIGRASGVHPGLILDEELIATRGGKYGPLTFTWVDAVPASIKLGTNYSGPADWDKAEYDSGGGWTKYSGDKTLPIVAGNRIRFRGDWRTSAGTFQGMFNGAYASNYQVKLSGMFLPGTVVPVGRLYQDTFSGCSGLTGSIPEGLFGQLTGAPATHMFNNTFRSCSGLTGSIPAGLFGQLSGAPATRMFHSTFFHCYGLTGSIPEGLFGQLAGAPATSMFNNTFRDCVSLTGPIPEGLFGQLAGAPAESMFYETFVGCRSIIGGIPSDLFGDIYGASQNIMFGSTFNGCTSLSGSIPQGLIGAGLVLNSNHRSFTRLFKRCSGLTGPSLLMADGVTTLFDAYPTANATECYNGCTGLSDYDEIPADWK